MGQKDMELTLVFSTSGESINKLRCYAVSSGRGVSPTYQVNADRTFYIRQLTYYKYLKLTEMKTLFKIWQAMAIATLLVAVLYIISGCTEANANENNNDIEYFYEDNYCVAPATGICLQDVQFDNGTPFYNGKPCVLTADVCELLVKIFYGNDWEEHPVAAIAFDCGSYYVIELD